MPIQTFTEISGVTLSYCKLSKALTVKVGTNRASAFILTHNSYWNINITANQHMATLNLGNYRMELGYIKTPKNRTDLTNFITDCFQHAHSTSPKPLTF